ncbi:chemotaxis protein CheW [Xanthobacter sp. KR7-65]|uniref:chemotaxis protein CheW n=1 Tax=Xanthobacter sp. KR7-65 TaxID=3156612 RepID=UPI0032B3473E
MAATATARRLSVHAGGHHIAIDSATVGEVIRGPRLTRVPHGPPALLGVMQMRGAVLPVVSLGRLLGASAASESRWVVVLRGNPGMGVAVDAVEKLGAGAAAAEADAPPAQMRIDDGENGRWFDLDAALREHFSGFHKAATAGGPHAGKGRAEAAAPALAFLGFSLAGQSYALPLDAVAQVMGAPTTLSALPSAESVLLGVMDLRGEILPVVCLRALLGLPEREVRPSDKVIVVRLHGQSVGLLVDQLSVILRAAPEMVSPAPTLFNRAAGEARIVSVLRLADAGGLVSILTPQSVFADARVARLLAETSERREVEMAPTMSQVARERFLMISLGAESYGLPLSAVDEVVRLPETLTRLPRAPDYVLGLMSLRGKVIPVIDQRRRFSVTGEGDRHSRRVVVVTIGQLQAGFAVDGVSRILEVNASEVMSAPELADDGRRLFDRAASAEGSGAGDVILLIDPKALLARAEADLLHDLAAKSETP